VGALDFLTPSLPSNRFLSFLGGGGVMRGRQSAVRLGSILMLVAAAISGQHRGLFVRSRRPPVRLARTQVPLRDGPVSVSRPLQRLFGAQSGTLEAVSARQLTGSEFRSTLPQFVSPPPRRLSAGGSRGWMVRYPLGRRHR
jgi:hypothetical protein